MQKVKSLNKQQEVEESFRNAKATCPEAWKLHNLAADVRLSRGTKLASARARAGLKHWGSRRLHCLFYMEIIFTNSRQLSSPSFPHLLE